MVELQLINQDHIATLQVIWSTFDLIEKITLDDKDDFIESVVVRADCHIGLRLRIKMLIAFKAVVLHQFAVTATSKRSSCSFICFAHNFTSRKLVDLNLST